MKWQSKRTFAVVQHDQAYQPWHLICILPPWGPYLATSNISSINKVNTKSNCQCSEIEHSTTSGRQIWQLNNTIHMTTSFSEWRQHWIGDAQAPSHISILQLAIQIEGCGGTKTQNTLLKQWGESEMDLGLCGLRDGCGKKASWRCRDSDSAREGWYQICWNFGIDSHKPQKNMPGDAECYPRQSERSCKFWQWG